jgi:hypothetical protein
MKSIDEPRIERHILGGLEELRQHQRHPAIETNVRQIGMLVLECSDEV